MIWQCSFKRHLSLCLIAMLVLPVGARASTPSQAAPPTATSGQQDGQSAARPDGIDGVGASPTAPLTSSTQQAGAPTPASQTPAQAPTPLGTAAAPETRPDGVPASTPSGAAIAPAKQKRVRKFSIRTALVVGAVVAVGIVAGVSLASPSRP